MVQVIQSDDSWGQAGRELGAGLAQHHMNRADEKALQNAIGGLVPNATPRQILDALVGTRTYSPEAKQTALKNYFGAAEFEELQRKSKEQEGINKAKNEIEKAKANKVVTDEQKQRQQVKTLVKQLNVPDEQKEQLGESLTLSGAEGLLKEQMKPKKGEETKLTPFEKKVQEKQAEDYIELNKQLPVLENNRENITHVEDLARKLGYFGGLTGPISGLVGTKLATELEAASFPLLESIVKIFNPSGPIATRKLEIIKDKYQIKATDPRWKTEGKIAALRRFNNQAIQRAKDKIALYEEYNGVPPKQAVEKFDRDSDTLSDAMIDYDVTGEEVEQAALPEQVIKDVGKLKGKTITSPDGQKYYSDGTRWVKK